MKYVVFIDLNVDESGVDVVGPFESADEADAFSKKAGPEFDKYTEHGLMGPGQITCIDEINEPEAWLRDLIAFNEEEAAG